MNIIQPVASNISQISDKIPYKAKINIRSKKGKVFPKDAISSMFPVSWDLKRIQEEIAFVYETTIAKSVQIFDENGQFKKYLGKNSNDSFNILIEVDHLGNIKNGYPYI